MSKARNTRDAKAVNFAGNEWGEDATRAGPKFRDKKFEGYSDVRGGYEKKKIIEDKSNRNRDKAELNESYRLLLQRQVAIMESQIKMLKDREVDQKNKASGYETLLRDGIPLNEHFLALKNKFNNEKDAWKKRLEAMNEEIKREIEINQEKSHLIIQRNAEWQRQKDTLEQYKDEHKKWIEKYQNILYDNQHRKTQLIEDRKKLIQELATLKQGNLVTNRQIEQSTKFTSKKDDLHKKQDEEQKELADQLKEFNKEILEKSWKLEQEIRRLKDKDLIKNARKKTMDMQSEHKQLEIEINIKKSKKDDFEAKIAMTEVQIEEVLIEKRKLEKENIEIMKKLDGRGFTETDNKKKQFEAEREKHQELKHDIEKVKEEVDIHNEQLAEEEKLAKEMLNVKLDTMQTKETIDEDYAAKSEDRKKNAEEIIAKEIHYSELITKSNLLQTELGDLDVENDKYTNENLEVEEENKNLNLEIQKLLRRIELNYLLKEVDVEEMKLVEKNTQTMNSVYKKILKEWGEIQVRYVEI